MKRVVIATCALGMGINIPHVRYVVQYLTPNTLIDMMQQAGQGGRDHLQAQSIVYYTKQQFTQCSKDLKTVVNHKGCHSFLNRTDRNSQPAKIDVLNTPSLSSFKSMPL